MSNQTIVQFGSVTLYHCSTVQFEQVEERSPDGADTMYWSYSMAFVGFVHGKGNSTGIRTDPAGSSAPDQFTTVGRRMADPRQELLIRNGCDENGAGGVVLLSAKPANATGDIANDLDVNNGPRCTRFQILQVVADELFKVEAHFVACLPTCVRIGNDSRVLSNKWSTIDELDADRVTTRTYSGRLRVSAGTINPNSFRGVVVPALVPGMKRASMTFECSADGLWLNYTVVDREAMYAAPKPATSWDVRHTESTGDGLMNYGEISIQLSAPRSASKKELIAVAVKIFDDRLRGLTNAAQAKQNKDQPKHIVDFVSVTDTMSDNGPLRVSMVGRVSHFIKGDGQNALKLNLAFAAEKLGTYMPQTVFPGYDVTRSQDGRAGETPKSVGEIPLAGAWVTYLQSHCHADHGLHCANMPLIDLKTELCPVPTVEVRVVPTIPDEPPDYYSERNAEGIYTSYQAESLYSTSQNRAALPIAGQESGGTDAADTVAVIQLAPASTRRTHKLVAVRAGKEPELPEPVDQYVDGQNVAKLLTWSMLPVVPRRTADGIQIYQVSAEYHYALTRPAKPTDKQRLGVNPWEKSGLLYSSAALLSTYTEDSKQAV